MGMTSIEKIELLSGKGLKNGDMVSFDVENPSVYWGPREGVLVIGGNLIGDDPYIQCKKGVVMSIDRGWDAYIHTIKNTGASNG